MKLSSWYFHGVMKWYNHTLKYRFMDLVTHEKISHGTMEDFHGVISLKVNFKKAQKMAALARLLEVTEQRSDRMT